MSTSKNKPPKYAPTTYAQIVKQYGGIAHKKATEFVTSQEPEIKKIAAANRTWGKPYFGLSSSQARAAEASKQHNIFEQRFLQRRLEIATGLSPGGLVPSNAVPFDGAKTAAVVQPKPSQTRSAAKAGAKTPAPAATSPKEERQSTNSTQTPRVASTSKPFTFSIAGFRAEISEGGVMPVNSFILLLDTTAPMFKNMSLGESSTRMLAMRCDTASIPGVNLMMQDVTKFGYGPISRMPHAAQYNTMNLSFIDDALGTVHKFFTEWLNLIVQHRSKGGREMTTADKNGMYAYNVGYKEDYAIPQLSLLVVDRALNNVIECSLYDAFPIMLNDVALSWTSQDEVSRLNITLTFTDLDIDYLGIAEEEKESAKLAAKEEKTPTEEKAKKSLLGKLFKNVGKNTARGIIGGVVESTERKIYRIRNDIFN